MPNDPVAAMQHNQLAIDIRNRAGEIERAPADMPDGQRMVLVERVHLALGHTRHVAGTTTQYYVWHDASDNTLRAGWDCLTSRDDAHALLPDGWRIAGIEGPWRDAISGEIQQWRVCVSRGDSPEIQTQGCSEPAARTAAALRARAAEMEG